MGEISGGVLASFLSCGVIWNRNHSTEFALPQGKSVGSLVSAPGGAQLPLQSRFFQTSKCVAKVVPVAQAHPSADVTNQAHRGWRRVSQN